MVDVLFAHQAHPIEPLGIGYLASSIARGGHATRVALTPKDLDKAFDLVDREIQEKKPRIFAQSVIFGSHGYAIDLNKRVKSKNPDIVTFLGGPAATFTPELLERGFDAICRYEGEYPFLEFCDALSAGLDVGNIPNIWVKENPALFRTEVKKVKKNLDSRTRDYVHDTGYDPIRKRFVNDTRRLLEGGLLHDLPAPDRAPLYDHLVVTDGKDPKVFADNPIKHFMHTRGCAFHCAYCHVEAQNLENRGKGAPVRRRTNESVAQEVSDVMKRYGGGLVYFQDDIAGFAYTPDMAREFAEVFGKLGWPSHAHVRFDLVSRDEKIAVDLARGGVTGVHIAIEAGNEELRNKVHRRGMSDAQILRGAEYLHRHGIQMMSQNILGAPGETRAQMVQTYELNRVVRPTFASASIFQPFPGTSELEYARDKGHLPPEMDQDRLIDTFGLDTFYRGSILALDPAQKRWLEVFHKFFAIGVDENLPIDQLERRMAPYLMDSSRDSELEEMYRAHRHQKDEVLYGVKLGTRVEVPKSVGGLAGRAQAI